VHHRLKQGFFVTTGWYSDDARAFANDTGTLDQPVKINLWTSDNLTTTAGSLLLTKDLIAAAKRRWGVPEDPPPDMIPQRRPRWRGRTSWGKRRRGANRQSDGEVYI
jgi:hypothetical protein